MPLDIFSTKILAPQVLQQIVLGIMVRWLVCQHKFQNKSEVTANYKGIKFDKNK